MFDEKWSRKLELVSRLVTVRQHEILWKFFHDFSEGGVSNKRLNF